MANTQPVRPLVPTTIRTEFGEVLESEAFNSRSVGRDLTYVPGYSDMRRERDLAIGEVARGERKADSIPTLPVRLQWVRSTRLSGQPDGIKRMQYGKDGYRMVTKADVGQPWFTDMPPGAIELAGGEIHDQGDCVLMVADAKTAARRSAENRRDIDRLTQHAAAGDFMQLGARTRGSEPTFESTPGPQIPVPKSAIKA